METEILSVVGGIKGGLYFINVLMTVITVLIDHRAIANGTTSATTSIVAMIDIPLHDLLKIIGNESAVANYQNYYDAADQLGRISKKTRSSCSF